MSLSRHSTLSTRSRKQIRLKWLLYSIVLQSVFFALNLDCPPEVICAAFFNAAYMGVTFGLILAVWVDHVIHKLECFSALQLAKLLLTDPKASALLVAVAALYLSVLFLQSANWDQATRLSLASPYVGAVPGYLLGRRWRRQNRTHNVA